MRSQQTSIVMNLPSLGPDAARLQTHCSDFLHYDIRDLSLHWWVVDSKSRSEFYDFSFGILQVRRNRISETFDALPNPERIDD